MMYSVFLSNPRGLEYLLEEEVKSIGAHVVRVSPQGVYAEADLETLYKLCLWSRIANRVQLILFSGQVHDENAFYELANQFPWQTVFSPQKTLAIEFHGESKFIRNTMFGAQLLKDAIVDFFRKQQNIRPNIDKEYPDVLLHAYLKHDELTVSLDLNGYSLHQRGYRKDAGFAPIKENVAAALLMRANWPAKCQQGFGFYDPLCGSGTIAIEAALMAANIAPGLFRDDQAFIHWVEHQPSLCENVREQALSSVKRIEVPICASDASSFIIEKAKQNAERAGVLQSIDFSVHQVSDIVAKTPKGVVVTNPPYGERMEDMTTLLPLYQTLGKTFYEQFQGWDVAMLTSNPMLAKATGIRFPKHYKIFNGAIECALYCTTMNAENKLKGATNEGLSTGAEMFLNRLKKNHHHLSRWAKRMNIEAYRLYDADMPEYAFAIDCYKDYVVLQEYAAPATISPLAAENRKLDVLQAVPVALDIPSSHLVVKVRKPQKGSDQYQTLATSGKRMEIQEGYIKCSINLRDYLDTGIFLDHRLMRLRFGQLMPGQRFLNCFCYTGVASLHAAKAGAITTNIDLSKTYLDWAEDNFRLNGLSPNRHRFIQEDCRAWLKEVREKFDVIFLDPPSFSNSKRMKGTLDIQRDHVELIQDALRLLNEDGILYFSTNLQKFRLSSAVEGFAKVRDITKETIDEDFKRRSNIHQCFELSLLT